MMELYSGYLEDHFNLHKLSEAVGVRLGARGRGPWTWWAIGFSVRPELELLVWSLVRGVIVISLSAPRTHHHAIICCVRCQPPLCPKWSPGRSGGRTSLLGESIAYFRLCLALPACACACAHSIPSWKERKPSLLPFPSFFPSVLLFCTHGASRPAGSCLCSPCIQHRQLRLAAGVHDAGGVARAVRAGAPQDGVRSPGARDGHVEQRAVQGGQQRPRHQRVHRHGGGHQARDKARRCSAGTTRAREEYGSGNKQAAGEGTYGPEKARAEQRGCSEESPAEKGLHPAARDKPDEAGPVGAGASTGSTAGRVRKWEHGKLSSRIHRVDRSRRRRVRDRVQALGGRAEEAHGRADVGAPGAADVGAGAPLAGGDGAQQLRAPLQDQGGGRQRGRVPRHVGHVEDPRREVLPLDRRVPAVGGPKDPEPAAGAAGGGAAHARGWPPEHVDAGGGRPVAGHGEAAAEPRGDPDRRGRPVRGPRRLHAADGHRGGEAQRARQLRHPGGPSPADDAATDAQDPDDAAGGHGPPGARRLLPAPPHAELAVGGAPAGGGD